MDEQRQTNLLTYFQATHTNIFSDLFMRLDRISSESQHKYDQKLEKAQQAILDSLSFPGMRSRYDQVRDAEYETFDWTLNPPPDQDLPYDNFTKWLDSKELKDHTYWVFGKPGSGKSTLMRYLSEAIGPDHLREWSEGQEVLRAGFFFWSPGQGDEKYFQGLLYSLLCQLLDQRRDLIQWVVPTENWRAAQARGSPSIPWTVRILSKTFHDFLSLCLSNAKILLFIDGLDEMDGNDEKREEMLNFISSITQSGKLKVCLSSRPWNIYEEQFEDVPKLKLQALTREDLRKYIFGKMQSNDLFQKTCRAAAADAEQLLQNILDKAQGVFLWVKLVVAEMVRGVRDGEGVNTLQRKLKGIPADLDLYFRRILESIDPVHREEASILLQIVLDRHGWTTLDLSFAEEGNSKFAFQPNYDLFALDLADSEALAFKFDQMARRINSRCLGLLECDNNSYELIAQGRGLHVQFLHRSCYESLETTTSQILLHQYTKGKFDVTSYGRCVLLVRAFAFVKYNVNSYMGALSSYERMIPRGLQDFDALCRRIGEEIDADSEMKHFVNAIKTLVPLLETFCRRAYEVQDRESLLVQNIVEWGKQRPPVTMLAVQYHWKAYLKDHLDTFIVKQCTGMPLLNYTIPGYWFHAESRHQLWTTRALLELGADPNEEYAGSSVFFRAITARNWPSIPTFLRYIELFISQGASELVSAKWPPISKPWGQNRPTMLNDRPNTESHVDIGSIMSECGQPATIIAGEAWYDLGSVLRAERFDTDLTEEIEVMFRNRQDIRRTLESGSLVRSTKRGKDVEDVDMDTENDGPISSKRRKG